MFKSTAFALVASSMLAGCSAIVPRYDLPSEPDNGRPTIKAIEQHIRCELGEVASPDSPLVALDAVVAVQINLDTNDTAGLSPVFTYMNAPFSLNAGATVSNSREQSFSAMLHYSMKEISSEFTSVEDWDKCKSGFTNLEGRLGLKENMDLAFTFNNLDTSAALTGTTGTFGGFVTFVFTKNLNAVGPTWALKHFTGPGKFASVSDVNTDKIVYGVAFPDPKEPKKNQTKRAEGQISDINLNHLSTQLGLIRAAVGN